MVYLPYANSADFLALLFHDDWIELVELYEKKRSSIVTEFKVVSLAIKTFI